MVVIHAIFKMDPKHRNEFIEQAKLVTKGSQAEEGNISYNFYEDAEKPNTFVFLEKWKDQTAINEHEETHHFKNFSEVINDLIIEPVKVEILEASNIIK
ncbi:putative quinol monooxygenase [Metabacillus sp. RGM 3146]|uniref:putative quinol monooxygenase n=1 Tax=Metabacillus sp. RGM 3146 TaxID=3401092 RepID=UPI003B9B8901